MKLTETQTQFKLNVEQKKYAEQLLDSFGIDKCIKYIDDLIKDEVKNMHYLKAHLYHLIIKHIIYFNDNSGSGKKFNTQRYLEENPTINELAGRGRAE